MPWPRVNVSPSLSLHALNARRFSNQWPVHVGLMRGYAAMGDTKKALQGGKARRGPGARRRKRKNLQGLIKQLEEGNDIN